MSEPTTPPGLPDDPHELAPADYCDPVIEAYKKDVDRTLLRQNLKLTVEQRIRKAISFHKSIAEWRAAGRPKDLERIAELQALLEEQRKCESSS